MAFPDSYSLMTEFFSLMACASAAWLIFLARRACCSASLKSWDTVSWRKVSAFSSSFFALATTECADLLPPAPSFLSVSTAAPERRAAFTSPALFAALPVGPVLRRTTGSQSWAACKDGPLGILLACTDCPADGTCTCLPRARGRERQRRALCP